IFQTPRATQQLYWFAVGDALPCTQDALWCSLLPTERFCLPPTGTIGQHRVVAYDSFLTLYVRSGQITLWRKSPDRSPFVSKMLPL
ncbi:MAG: hypothetical protein ACOVNV_11935, partial [Pirellulaceae bacterium]